VKPLKNDKDSCPHCGVSLIGKTIPKKLRKYYSPPYHYKREIGIYDRDKDMTVAFECPDCKKRWGFDLCGD